MSLSHVGPLKVLLLDCADPANSEDERHEAARVLRERFDLHEEIDALGYLTRASAMPPPAVSLILSIIYVVGRKRPDDSGPIRELRRFIADRSRSSALCDLRTRAFMLLMLLDLEQAGEEAAASMPEMSIVVDVERKFPTVRRDTSGAAYEEATLQLLFH